jgi:hypothetical protein
VTRSLVIRRDDGGVSAGVIPDAADPEREVAKWQSSHAERALSWSVVDGSVDVTDEYRDAWRDHDGKAAAYDLPRARELHRAKLRRERAPLLAALDVDSLKALEAAEPDANAKLRAVGVRKQALRDAPADPRIDAAETIEELRAVQLPSPERSRT